MQRADGTVEVLSVGTKVFQNDVVSTGANGKLSITFADGSMFTLAANSRMVLDELVFDPDSNENSGVFSLVEGGFVFVAGQVAKTGGMEINTPSATMGIRGTTGIIEITTLEGQLSVAISLTEDFDGSGTGVIEVYDLDGNLISTITSVDEQWVVPINGEAYVLDRSTSDVESSDDEILADAANAFAIALGRVEGGESFVQQGGSSQGTAPPDPAPTEEPGEPEEGEGGSDGGGGGPVETEEEETEVETIETPFDDAGPLDTNSVPTTSGQSLTIDEDSILEGGIIASDDDGDILTYSVTGAPQNGTVVLLGDGAFSFIPDENFFGTDSFSYQVSDGQGGVASGTISIEVEAINDTPEIEAGITFGIDEDTVLTGDLGPSVTDVEGDDLTFSVDGPIVTFTTFFFGGEDQLGSGGGTGESIGGQPQNGQLVIQPNGTFTYTPNQDFAGPDSFTFRVTDSGGATTTADVQINIAGINDAPVASDDEQVVDEDGQLTGDLNLITFDADGDDLTFGVYDNPAGSGSGSASGYFGLTGSGSATGFILFEEGNFPVVGEPDHGELTINPNGTFTYTPDADYNGTDQFTFEATDPDGETTTATVYIFVNPVNDAPIASDGSGTTPEDVALTGNLSNLVDDIDGDMLFFSPNLSPVNGSITIDTNGNFTFNPDPEFNGTGSFTYLVEDPDGESATGSFSVTVTPVNDDPIAQIGIFGTDEDVPLMDSLEELVQDEDSATLTFSLVNSGTNTPTGGDVVVNSDGTFTFTPAENFNGPAGFSYKVDDGDGGSAISDVTIEVAPVNDAPVITDFFVSVDTDTLTAAIPASDPDGDMLMFSLGPTQPSLGSAQINMNDTFTYFRTPGSSGFDTFEITVSDGNETRTATFTMGIGDNGGLEAFNNGLSAQFSFEATESAPAGSVTMKASTVTATPINIVFAMDESGSFSSQFATQIASVRSAIDALRDQFEGAATQVDIKLITFDSGVAVCPTYDLIEDQAAIDTTLTNIQNAFNGGVTNWVAALDASKTFFDLENLNGNEVDIIYLITDGYPGNSTGQIAQSLASLRDAHEVEILTFGIGAGFNSTPLEQLYLHPVTDAPLSFDSDGDAVLLNNASQLTDALTETPLFNARIASVTLTVETDGSSPVTLVDTDAGIATNAVEDIGLDAAIMMANIYGIEDHLGNVNNFTTQAVFDLDDNLETTADQITVIRTGQLVRPEESTLLEGGPLPDLLVGGPGDDTIIGGDSGDLLIAGGGADSIQGGEGGDQFVLEDGLTTDGAQTTIEGGAGRDALKFAIDGDLTIDVLPNLSINQIETIDLTNGFNNHFAISLADILAVNSDGDPELVADPGTVLVPGADTMTIYGEMGDTVFLDPGESGDYFVYQNGSVSDAPGNQFQLYDFVDDNATVIAQVAVHDDVMVDTGGVFVA